MPNLTSQSAADNIGEKRTSVITISKGKNRVNNAAFTDGL